MTDPIVDMDTHIREYVDVERTYRDTIDPAYREQLSLLSTAVARRRESGMTTALFMHPQAVIEPAYENRPLGVHDTFGILNKPDGTQASVHQEAVKRGPVPREVHWDPSIRVRDMDEAGVDMSIMFPSHAASYCTLREVGFETALHEAFHRYCAAYASEAAGRLRWVFNTTMRDVPTSVSKLTELAERDNNLVGVLVSPSCPSGRLLDTPDLHPLYARAQELDLPIMVHGGVLRPPYTAGATELDNAGFLIRAVYQPWAGMTAIGALIGGGVFDLFPRLRVGVFETGGGWLPWLVERLDDSWCGKPELTPNLKRKPSDVVAEGRLFQAVECSERYLEHAVEELGEDLWLFATDYPHQGSPWPHGVRHIADRHGMSDGAKRKILGGNAVRMCPRLAA